MDHVLRYHDDPNVKMIVVLGEVSLPHYISHDVCTKWVCSSAQ